MFITLTGCTHKDRVSDNASSKPVGELYDQAQKMVRNENNPDSALKLLQIISSRAETGSIDKRDAEPAAIALCFASTLYVYHAHDYRRAVEAALLSRRIASEYHLPREQAVAECALAGINYDEGVLTGRRDYVETTLHLFRTAFETAIEYNDIHLAGIAALNYCSVAFDNGFDTQAADMAAKATSVSGIAPWQIMQLHAIGAAASGYNDKALAMVDSTMALLKKEDPVSQRNYIALSKILKATIFDKEGKNRQYRQSLDSLLADTNIVDNPIAHIELLENLRKQSEAEGDTSAAREFELEMLRNKAELQKDNSINIIEEGKNNFRHKQLNADLLESQTKLRTFRGFLWVILTVCLLLCLMGLWVFRKYMQLKRAQAAIVRLDRKLNTKESGAVNPQPHDPSQIEDLKKVYEQAVKILETNEEVFSDSFTIGRLCELAGLKQSALSEAVTRLAGCSVSTLIAERRIAEACRMMRGDGTEPAPTIDAIAFNVGYRSRSHFSSVFKKTMGMSPGVYMRNLRK